MMLNKCTSLTQIAQDDCSEFRVMLNGSDDLLHKLEEFKKACDAHEKHKRKHCKRRYYQIGLAARVNLNTTEEELQRLLVNGTRTFFVDIMRLKPVEAENTMVRLQRAIVDYQLEEEQMRVVSGIAVDIIGDCCRVARLHNNCSLLIHQGDVMTLTTDAEYKYSGFKEIVYLLNFKYYFKGLRLEDWISVGDEVRGRVVKRLKNNVAIFIERAGIINSYDFVDLPVHCYILPPSIYRELIVPDLEEAVTLGAHYIVLCKLRNKNFLEQVHKEITENKWPLKLIGALDFEFITSKMIDLLSLVKLIDYLWIPNMFNVSPCIEHFINDDVLPITKCLRKPIIATIPLERCSDFRIFEGAQFLWKIDAMFIEKSPWCHKYPLIVKKLMPIRDFRIAVVENQQVLKNIINSFDSIVNFIIRTISSVECHAVFVYSKCEAANTALGRVEIYTPVFVMLPLTNEDSKEDEFVEANKLKIQTARALNFRRNLRALVYSKYMNECNFEPIEYGINYARKTGVLNTGDFVMTIEVRKQEKDTEVVEFDNEDVIILRAFYLPPLRVTDKFKY